MNKDSISTEPGMRVRRLRERLHLTRQQFEKLTGVKANTLRHIETGSQALTPTKARSLSIIFMYYFKFSEEEASEDFLLYGATKDIHLKKG